MVDHFPHDVDEPRLVPTLLAAAERQNPVRVPADEHRGTWPFLLQTTLNRIAEWLSSTGSPEPAGGHRVVHGVVCLASATSLGRRPSRLPWHGAEASPSGRAASAMGSGGSGVVTACGGAGEYPDGPRPYGIWGKNLTNCRAKRYEPAIDARLYAQHVSTTAVPAKPIELSGDRIAYEFTGTPVTDASNFTAWCVLPSGCGRAQQRR